MTIDFERVKAVFQTAVAEHPPDEWDRYLDEACADDAELRREVSELLRVHEQGGSLLDSPVLANGQPTIASVSEGPGTVIGPYKLLQQIGEGGMGVVFMAEQTEPIRRTVALKIIKPGMDTRQVIARFEAERQALAMMDHPNIAKVLDAGTTGGGDRIQGTGDSEENSAVSLPPVPSPLSPTSGRPYFVMELVKGVPITQYCDQQRLPIRERLELFAQVCHAVQHAHQKGIIHRDLKPSNVLVAEYDGKPVPKVIDFGVAKATAQKLTERTMFTEFGQVIGTVEYMSPEQAKLNQLDIDTRSDIYSLGVLLYELLTGSTPFEQKRMREAAFDEVLRIIREEEPPKPSTKLSSSDTLASIAANRHTEPARLSKEVSSELDWIVMKALEKDRNRRYETANGFAADIERYLRDEPVRACPPSATYRFRKLVRRNKLAFVAAGAVMTALVLGLTVSSWLFFKERTAKHRAQTETSKALAIGNLLQEMFSAASPEEFRSDYTVRELLDSYSEKTENQLTDQPETKATIQESIGYAYRCLGLADQAEPHLASALALRERTFGPNSIEVARSLMEYGLNLFERRDLVGAESYVQQAIAIYKNSNVQSEETLALLRVLQLVLIQQSKIKEAETVSNEALALGKRIFPDGHQELASILTGISQIAMHNGKAVEAERYAREAVIQHRKFYGETDPQTAWGIYQLGCVLQLQRRFEEADRCFREALSIFFERHDDPNFIGTKLTLEHLRDILTTQGDEAGLKRLQSEVDLHNSEAIARASDLQRGIFRGNLHRDSGEWDKAVAEYSSVIAQKPDMAKAWSGRGGAYLSKGEWTKAVEDFSQAIILQPRESWNWHERAFAYLQLGEHEKSIADHSQAIRLNDADAGQRLRRGKSYETLGQMEKADADYSRAIELNPNYWENWTSRARVYVHQGQWEKAESDLENAIETCAVNKPYEKNSMAWALCTWFHPRLGKPEVALGLAKEAVAGAPNDGNHWNTLGVAQYRNGNWQEAIDALNKSLELRGGGTSMDWFFLAMAYWQQGNKEQARTRYDKAVEWMEKNKSYKEELNRFRQEAEELMQIADEKPATKSDSKSSEE